MDLREYQTAVAEEPQPDVLEQAKMLARHLRFLVQIGRVLGYSLEELASLDREEA